jgi:flagellin-specific chaperone FliS
VQRIASVYNFIFRALVDANRRRDERKLDEALRVLSIERETWRLVCQQATGPEKEDHPLSAVPPPLSQKFPSASRSFSWEA